MLIASLFIIDKRQKQSKCPLTDEWIDKNGTHMDKQKWYIHTTEYYSAKKRKEVLLHDTVG